MKPELVAGNRLDLLDSGAEYFPKLIEAIDSARATVRLETYIFADDRTGADVSAALVRAVSRNVDVFVLVDGFGGRDFEQKLMPKLLADGVRVLIFQPETTVFHATRKSLRRLHRKLVSIDGAVGFVGGINIIDDLNLPQKMPPRFDFAVRIEGPLAASIEYEMLRLWRAVSPPKGRLRKPESPPRVVPSAPVADASAALLVRDNVRHRRDIENAYLRAIRHARKEVILANAYFLPGPRVRRTLISAAHRGVTVRVIVQGRLEYRLQHYATQYLYDSLLRAGVHIVEYDRTFLHAKVAVVDGEWATVGSSNIDPFSLLMAREANVVTDSRELASALRQRLLVAAAAESHEVRQDEWENVSAWERFRRWLSYHIIRWLLALTRTAPATQP